MLNITAARRSRQGQLEVNMAPLIDMVFILLIFFLVTTSFVRESGVDVQRPSAATAVSRQKANILIGITNDNRIFMENREMDIATLRLSVERALAENPDSIIVVVADRRSSTGTAVRVMDACRLAGATNISLAARPGGQ